MIVFCVFWTLLTNVVFGPNKSTWRRIQPTISHTLNLLLPLLDVIFSDTPVHWPLTTYPVIFILFYGMTIMFCHTVFGSPWPYPFLDRLNNYSNSISWVPMLLFGVFLVVLVLTFWFIVQKMTLKVQVVREKRVEKANMKETVTIV
ncbi:hypothetical protein HDV02_002928 [Globomyces sp. JEL0801]|nr:hypothetical protein HDV02_002928 [Globomyces sp. JEL0801]